MKNNRKWFAAALCLGAFAISGCKGKAPETVTEPEPQAAPVVEELFGLDAVRQPGAKVCVDPYVVDALVKMMMSKAFNEVYINFKDWSKRDDFEGQLKYNLDTSIAALVATESQLMKTTCSSNFIIESLGTRWTIPIVYTAQVAASQQDFLVGVSDMSAVTSSLNAAVYTYSFSMARMEREQPAFGVENQPSDEEKWAARPKATDLAEKSTEQPTSEPMD